MKVREDRPVKYGKVEASDYVEGKTDSQAVFIWYVDMQCPACAQMAPVVQSLYEKYGDRVELGRASRLKNPPGNLPAA